MKGSDFVFAYVDRLRHLCFKISLDCGKSTIDSTYWIKTEKEQQIVSIT